MITSLQKTALITQKKLIKTKPDLILIKYIQNTKHSFRHLGTSCLETGRAKIPKQILSLHYVPRTIALQIQKDRSNRLKAIAWKPLCLQTDDDETNNTIRPQSLCGCINNHVIK